jgi:branched-chain amino acid transport system substrate-binding protein
MFTNILKKSAVAATLALAAGGALAQNIKIGSILSVSGPPPSSAIPN